MFAAPLKNSGHRRVRMTDHTQHPRMLTHYSHLNGVTCAQRKAIGIFNHQSRRMKALAGLSHDGFTYRFGTRYVVRAKMVAFDLLIALQAFQDLAQPGDGLGRISPDQAHQLAPIQRSMLCRQQSEDFAGVDSGGPWPAVFFIIRQR